MWFGNYDYSEILDMQEYGYKEIGHLSQWKLGGQLLRGWFDKVYMPERLHASVYESYMPVFRSYMPVKWCNKTKPNSKWNPN